MCNINVRKLISTIFIGFFFFMLTIEITIKINWQNNKNRQNNKKKLLKIKNNKNNYKKIINSLITRVVFKK